MDAVIFETVIEAASILQYHYYLVGGRLPKEEKARPPSSILEMVTDICASGFCDLTPGALADRRTLTSPNRGARNNGDQVLREGLLSLGLVL